MLTRAACAVAVTALFAMACGKVLGLGDPKAYPPDGSVEGDSIGKIPVTTEDGAACGNANLVTDPNNCGRCGHSCQGSTCERALCVPVGITPADSEVFAVNGGRVFSLTQSQIIRTDADGAHFLIADAMQAGTPRSIYASAVHVLWSGDLGVQLCSINGCGTEPPMLLSTAGKRTGPIGEIDAVDPLYPYVWANYTDSTVEKYSLTAPAVLASNVQIEQAVCPPLFAETDGGAYLIEQPAGQIQLFHSDPPPVDEGGAADECAFTVVGANVYYTDASSVWRLPINADGSFGARQLVSNVAGGTRVVAADDTDVYWVANTGETAIARCPIEGCTTPDVLVDELPAVKALAIEGDFIYFAVYLDDAFENQIYKVAK